MPREVWGLEIDPPDEIQIESAQDGYAGVLEFHVRVAKHRAESPFVNNLFLREWAAQHPNQTSPLVARLTFSLDKNILLMHNLLLTSEGKKMLRESKQGGIGSLIEIRTMKWLKENFPKYLIMDFNPTGYRLEQLRRRGQPIRKPIPVSQAFELIKKNMVRQHNARFRWKRIGGRVAHQLSRINTILRKTPFIRRK